MTFSFLKINELGNSSLGRSLAVACLLCSCLLRFSFVTLTLGGTATVLVPSRRFKPLELFALASYYGGELHLVVVEALPAKSLPFTTIKLST